MADRARYEVGEGIADGSKTVAFRNTAMFQCMVHKFTVRYGTCAYVSRGSRVEEVEGPRETLVITAVVSFCSEMKREREA